MGKDDKCCVPFCGNRRKLKRTLSYYRIPQNPAQRVAWLDVIRKDPATIAANDRICSVHFVSGKPSPFLENVDWKPTLCVNKKQLENESTQPVACPQIHPSTLPPVQPLKCVDAPLSPSTVLQSSPITSHPTPEQNSVSDGQTRIQQMHVSVKRKLPASQMKSQQFCEKPPILPPVEQERNTTKNSSEDLPPPVLTPNKINIPPKINNSNPAAIKNENPTHCCVLCNEKLPSKEALQDHFRCHANGEGFAPVRVMDKPISSGNGVTTSHTSSTGAETWTCDICKGRVFTSKSTYLTHHMRYHPQETGHFCPHCGRMFPLRVDRDRHLVNHPDKGPYTPISCPVCKVDFYNSEALNYHMQNHQKVQEITSRVNDTADFIEDIRPSKRLRFDSMGEPQFCYYCPWCGKEYIQKYNLESHVRKMHQTMAKAERLFYCETCDSTFYNQSALMQHNFGHQQNQGYLLNPADMCKVEIDEEVNMLSQILPVAAANPNQSIGPAGNQVNDGKIPAWPDWMNALPPELLRAIKQEPNTPASSPVPGSVTPTTTSMNEIDTFGTSSKNPTQSNTPNIEEKIIDGISSFLCQECNGNFPTMVALKQHRCLPGKDNPMIKKEVRCDLTCGICGSSFSSDTELASHLLTHEVYLCSECGQELPNKTQYVEHQSQHLNGELRIPLNAFLPENENLQKKLLGIKIEQPKEDEKKHDNKKENEQEQPQVEDEDKQKQKQPIKDKNNKKDKKDPENSENEQFVCGLCDQHFPDQSSLELHFREMGDHASHNSRFSVTCNVCGLSFTVEAFKKHSHSRPSDAPRSSGGNSIPIKCGICQENFSTKEEIDAHFASHPETARDISRRSFLCNVCVAEDPALALLASFSSLRELYDHHARQHPQMSSNYQCRLCGMRFFEQWDLASHFAKHLPENIRNQCQVVFKNGQLKATFVCERCGQVFNYEVHLANHLRNNTCLKWACHICGRGNRSAKHRNQHIREHHPSDVLRYVCGVDGCQKKETFSKRTLVHAHIRFKHPEILQKSSDTVGQNDDLDMYVIEEGCISTNDKKDLSSIVNNSSELGTTVSNKNGLNQDKSVEMNDRRTSESEQKSVKES